MRSFGSRRAAHGRVQARQNSPVEPAVVPRQRTTLSVYYVTDGAMTATGVASMPTATGLVFDTAAPVWTYAPPVTAGAASTSSSSSSTPVQTITTDSASATATATATALTAETTTGALLDPAQKVYDGIANMALHSLPPAVIGIASGGSALIVLLALYCFICRWYYRRLPRSTKRWDVDDRAKKEVLYDDKPRYSPEDEAPQMAEDDRRGVAVGDSYFPQGETWQKFEGRTAKHPESFIYSGPGMPDHIGPHSPGSPTTGAAPHSGTGLARPRPQFAQGGGRRGPIESVFSNVSFPTTHRADSVRHSFYPEGYEHDGEVWDLASPGLHNEGPPRPSFDSSFRSINRASIFGEASGRARGSVVIYDSQPQAPAPRSPSIADDPFAGPGDNSPRAASFSADRYAGKKSFDGPGKRSMDGYHARSRSRDVRALDTLAEDADELSSQGHGTIKYPPRSRAI